MPHPIIVDAAEEVACPKCSHFFPLSEGISRQAIERHAEAYEKSLAERRKRLEAQLLAEARAKAEIELRAKDAVLEKFRTEELQLRRRLHELEEAKKNVDVDYQRKLDEEMKRREALFQAPGSPPEPPPSSYWVPRGEPSWTRSALPAPPQPAPRR
jgi:hypothetical protein